MYTNENTIFFRLAGLTLVAFVVFFFFLVNRSFSHRQNSQAESTREVPVIVQKKGNVLAAFSEVVMSSTPTPTNTPTPTPTFTPTPTPTNTPTPTPTPTNTPTPSPTPTVLPTRVPAGPADIDQYFQRFSQEYGVEEELLRKIAVCESGYNSQAVSPGGTYAGMYQFHRTSWENTRREMGADPNPDLRMNPEEDIRTAAFKISRYGTGAWPSCN